VRSFGHHEDALSEAKSIGTALVVCLLSHHTALHNRTARPWIEPQFMLPLGHIRAIKGPLGQVFHDISSQQPCNDLCHEGTGTAHGHNTACPNNRYLKLNIFLQVSSKQAGSIKIPRISAEGPIFVALLGISSCKDEPL
jgi:hypothetical protein